MRIRDIALITGLMGAIVFTNTAQLGNTVRGLEKEVLRMHILANSDSEEDQSLKIAVRDRLLEKSDELFSGCETLDEMKRKAIEEKDRINSIAQEVIHEKGYDYPSETELVNMEFEAKQYDDITMPAGNYDALRVTIGKADGHNWWCVMYPPLCIPAAEEVRTDEETKAKHFSDDELDIMKKPEEHRIGFKCIEIFKSIGKKFSDWF